MVVGALLLLTPAFLSPPRAQLVRRSFLSPPRAQLARRWVRRAGTASASVTGSDDTSRLLGSSALRVSEACLGTMTWGVQNSEADAHAQLDYAIKERGVTMVDTAELYPVPLTSPDWLAGSWEINAIAGISYIHIAIFVLACAS